MKFRLAIGDVGCFIVYLLFLGTEKALSSLHQQNLFFLAKTYFRNTLFSVHEIKQLFFVVFSTTHNIHSVVLFTLFSFVFLLRSSSCSIVFMF